MLSCVVRLDSLPYGIYDFPSEKCDSLIDQSKLIFDTAPLEEAVSFVQNIRKVGELDGIFCCLDLEHLMVVLWPDMGLQAWNQATSTTNTNIVVHECKKAAVY